MTTESHNATQPSPLGAAVRKYRERAGLSIRQLATRAGVHHSYVARLETGEYDRPTPDVLQGIAKALDIDPAKLLRFIGVKPSTKLPGPKVYFRRAYGMTAAEAAEAATRVEEIVRELREHKRNNKQSRGGTNHEIRN